MKVAYYITAHGYGHGARSCDILNALHSAAPTLPIIVKTDLPTDFMQSRLGKGMEIRSGAFDVGLIQKDSIQADLPASLSAVEKLYQQEEQLIQQEVEFIRNERIGVVVSDIPALPLAAAQRAGTPNIATGNFGWDWIYSDFVQHDPRWKIYIEKIQRIYQQTDLLLRQPFSEPMNAFPNQIDLPLLAKPGNNQREHLALIHQADPTKKWILLSFTSLDLSPAAIRQLEHLSNVELFTVEPLSWPDSSIHCISRTTARFSDLLASMDVVVTKPGFGIVSECIANEKAIIYADRKHFLEYAVLVESIQRYCRNQFIPATELYAGNLAHALEKLETAPAPTESIARGGAEQAAQHILSQLA